MYVIPTLSVPASEISGEPHTGIAMALEALITPVLSAKMGDIVAIGASLVLTPDDLLFSDAGLSLYRLVGDDRIANNDILDSMTEDYDSFENQVIRSLHFMMNTDYFFEHGLRAAALEISPQRSNCISLEFIMLGEALLISKSDLTAAFANRVRTGDRLACLGDVMRSLWYVPFDYPDRMFEERAGKTIEAFLQKYLPIRTEKGNGVSLRVCLPEWVEINERKEFLPHLHTWNVNCVNQ